MRTTSGKTNTEKLLAELATKSFLNLWCYPNPYIKKPNRELCDLLVICDKHIIIFSDKNGAFSDTGDIKINWKRWFRKTIKESIDQLLGAERLLKKYPNEIYLDEKCQTKLPIPDPDKNFKIHLIAVANGATQHCQAYFGGDSTGSLFFSSISSHLEYPFRIGDENPEGTFIHILDEFTLPILIQELDTITDFTTYLEEKEKFLRLNKKIAYGGEEDLLAHYIIGYDENKGKHTFLDSSHESSLDEFDNIVIEPGRWGYTKKHPSYILKKEADQISYLWDALINQFTKHQIAGTSNTHGRSIKEHEGGVRYMALETRFCRRTLSKLIWKAIESHPASVNDSSPQITTLPISNQEGLIYLFIQFPFNKSIFNCYQKYNEHRQEYLYMACMAAKATLPIVLTMPITKVIGIATEPPKHVIGDISSEDMILLFCDEWSAEQQTEGEFFRNTLNIFLPEKMKLNKIHEKNFPDDIERPL